MKIAIRTLPFICFLCLAMLISNDSVGQKRVIRMAFFSPRAEDDIFWGQFISFMKEAVDDLGMNLCVYYADGNHMKMVEQVRQCILDDPPNVLVFQNFKKQGSVILKMAEDARIPSFIVNAGFSEKDNMGKPREKYQFWIGEMIPDDEEAGYTLAKILIRNANRADDGKVHMVALSGNLADNASIERINGLKRAVKNEKNVQLEQIFSTDWSSDIAQQKFNLIKRSRYPKTSVVWAAGDAIALGVIEGARKLDLTPGTNILTGGIDWSANGLKSVQTGDMSVTLGGHFMEGAWVAVLIYDYFNGKDFVSESVQIRSKMSAATRFNVSLYQQKLLEKNWKSIDFRKFSKCCNPDLQRYNFSVLNLISQIQQESK